MSTKLLEIIKAKIRESGPMDIGTYMELCLGHPEHGYYMTRDPFGVDGDFTTAPEVSQLFGEMIGAWLADLWIKMGSPPEVLLVECGPGRGTLMADIMRATKGVPGFHDAVKIYLMEMSPALRKAQSQKLGIYDPHWIDDLSGLPAWVPVLLVANEFLDALPIRQMERKGGQWFERRVSIGADDKLCLDSFDVDSSTLSMAPKSVSMNGGEGVFETSQSLNQYIKSVDILLKKQKGAALFVDYGHMRSAFGDTLQCVKSHRFANLFDTPGFCDITAHVDFENIANIALADGVSVHGPVTQRAFLQSLGVEERAERLWAVANEAQKESINTGLFRLIDTDEMGSLFKVIALCHDSLIRPEGFDEDL
jgi:NADH dehydrogenase [ubiquinone] 1 alpha subcomplex assembly factor 7